MKPNKKSKTEESFSGQEEKEDDGQDEEEEDDDGQEEEEDDDEELPLIYPCINLKTRKHIYKIINFFLLVILIKRKMRRINYIGANKAKNLC